MLHASMAAKKNAATKPASKGATKTPEKPAVGHRNRLRDIGDKAMRDALLRALKDSDWNLTRTAEFFEMHGPVTVLRAIESLGLKDEYEAARERGDVRPGRRPEE